MWVKNHSEEQGTVNIYFLPSSFLFPSSLFLSCPLLFFSFLLFSSFFMLWIKTRTSCARYMLLPLGSMPNLLCFLTLTTVLNGNVCNSDVYSTQSISEEQYVPLSGIEKSFRKGSCKCLSQSLGSHLGQCDDHSVH